MAADMQLQLKALPPAPPPPCIWCGWYVGLNAGYVWDVNTAGLPATDQLPVIPANFGIQGMQVSGLYPVSLQAKLSGFIGGGQAGYNWQHGSLVAGIEADIQGASARSSTTGTGVGSLYLGLGTPTPLRGAATVNRALDDLGTVRGRLGFAVTPGLLLYGTGGLAFGETNLAYTGTATNPAGSMLTGNASSTQTRTGYAAGAGLEYAWLQHWSVKAEYLHYDLGTQAVSFFGCLSPGGGANCSTATATVRNSGEMVRGGINYHF